MSTKLVIEGVATGRSDMVTFPPEIVHTIIVKFPETREPLDLKNEVHVAFIRDIARRGQDFPGIGRRNAQDLVELGPGNRRLQAIRDHINKDPGFWGAKGPLPYKVLIRTFANDADFLDCIVAENRHRENPSPIKLAHIASEYANTFGMAGDLDAIGDKMGFTGSRIRQLLNLLQHGNEVKSLVDAGQLPESTARQMIGLPEKEIKKTVERVKRGESAPKVRRAVDEARRENHRPTSRTVVDLKRELDGIDSDRAAALINWLAGRESSPLEVFMSDEPFRGATPRQKPVPVAVAGTFLEGEERP